MATTTQTQASQKAHASDPSRTAALVLPKGYEDLREPVPIRLLIPGEHGAYIVGRVAQPAQTRFEGGKPPRMRAVVADEEGNTITVVAFGDCRNLQERLKTEGDPVHLLGNMQAYKDQLQLTKPEWVPEAWRGWVRPSYAKTGQMSGPTFRESLFGAWEDHREEAEAELARRIEEAGLAVADMLPALAGNGTGLVDLLETAHRPDAPEEGGTACRTLDRIAAAIELGGARAGAAGDAPAREKRSICEVDPWIDGLLMRTGLSPSQSQTAAIGEIAADLETSTPMRRVLIGEVGSGKTLVYGLAVAATAYAGGRSAIIAPSAPLARQIAGTLDQWWPDLHVALVTAEETPPTHARIVVGTTALLHGDVGGFRLVVVDEQHRFSESQRMALVGPETNLLEVSATPIPRSVALLLHAGRSVSRIQPWTHKSLPTYVHSRSDGRARKRVLDSMAATVAEGGQVLVLYPRVEAGDTEGDERTAAQRASEGWESWFPGRVALIHGRMEPEAQKATLETMREGGADVLVATTVVEVGVDLPNLRHLVTVGADRFGMATLHQLRGRLARTGGQGRCDLIADRLDDADVADRLRVLSETTDGETIARADLIRRGPGALAPDGGQQSGWPEGLPGRRISLDDLEDVGRLFN